jgi:hypothetical protein
MSYGVNAAPGLMPLRYMNGAPWNGAVNTYALSVDGNGVGYGTSLGYGTPAKELPNGVVGLGAADEPLIGAFTMFEYTDPNNQLITTKTWYGGTVVKIGSTIRAFICDDPRIIYNVQTNSPNGLPSTTVFLDNEGFSRATLDQASIGVGATKNLKILRLVEDIRNRWSVGNNFPYNNVEVIINNSVFCCGAGAPIGLPL